MHCLIQGRNKKGIIFTFAAGNGGDDDTCAANGYVNSIYTISVGAVGINGIPAYYDEICSAKLVSGYVENLDDKLPDVVCTSHASILLSMYTYNLPYEQCSSHNSHNTCYACYYCCMLPDPSTHNGRQIHLLHVVVQRHRTS